ncbi:MULTISPECIES: SGNH/GDSL hydrolase family protein [Burkholderia]|uniref:SGNH/GDSL hydrolase family protein n=1 Tax=Burkholderia TaxID=32008 RepID=UPI0005B457AD|nr:MULTISPECIES: SGNH/GDSL hydrolase family protein [Burkholderia]MBA9948201.1 SGNH/GDSL hydrolase family protein [Burkholderia cepacia]MBA9978327.1 SGNH/GDSL hydrolase family protein [Burkholderia cepacia]MBA9996314.1 SGNH/GDSL hydrolase family protein [Burkholderia cepacia]MBB0004198.1 SGNH/GDSL hydrolase family protein [Burkholderia cepacia]MBB0011906.1 SGNH/GDSL hydrolase family protein [Burkholderia cepacia]
MASATDDMQSVRYGLTPQMAEYDRLLARSSLRWCPHIMFFHPRHYVSRVVNTDELGFRCGVGPRGEVNFSPSNLAGATEVNLLVGGSVVMGLGCTGDCSTIPSILTRSGMGNAPWVNMGGRGFTSAQELILFLLMRDRLPAIRHIVLLSGLNNLVLADPHSEFAVSFGDFFFSQDFAAAMAGTNERYRSRQSLWKRIRPRETEQHALGAVQPDNQHAPGERIGLAVQQIERDLRHWMLLTAGLDCTLTYVLQPFATWLDREPHESEQTIFESLDRHAGESGAVDGIRDAETGRRFRSGVEALCARNRVPFVDMNASLSGERYRDRWLFVDRAHLTDEGCEAAVETVGEVFSQWQHHAYSSMQASIHRRVYEPLSSEVQGGSIQVGKG